MREIVRAGIVCLRFVSHVEFWTGGFVEFLFPPPLFCPEIVRGRFASAWQFYIRHHSTMFACVPAMPSTVLGVPRVTSVNRTKVPAREF